MIHTALAYLGPGGAVTVLGSALALLAAIVLAFFGMVWYPLKRLLRWWRRLRTPQQRTPP